MEYVAIDPRKGRENRRLCYGLTDFYREYKAECKRQYGKRYTKRMVPRKMFLSILTMYLKELMIWIIEDAQTFRMPKRLGKLVVRKRECTTGELQEQRVQFCKPNEENKDKLMYFARNHFNGHFFVIKWRKLNARGTLRFVGWYSFQVTKPAKNYLSDLVFKRGTDPYSPDYDAPDDLNKSARNPLNLPPPCE